MNAYPVKSITRLSVAFSNETSAAADPSSVELTITLPSGSLYATGAVEHDSTGHYHYDYTVSDVGIHRYKFQGIGDLIVASPIKSFLGIA
jgi:hypothetical protein